GQTVGAMGAMGTTSTRSRHCVAMYRMARKETISPASPDAALFHTIRLGARLNAARQSDLDQCAKHKQAGTSKQTSSTIILNVNNTAAITRVRAEQTRGSKRQRDEITKRTDTNTMKTKLNSEPGELAIISNMIPLEKRQEDQCGY